MVEIKRKYVVPGDFIAEGSFNPENSVTQIENKFYSTKVGMAELINSTVRVIPLTGLYNPRLDDVVIGKVIKTSAFAWEFDIRSYFSGILPASNVFGRDFSAERQDLSKKFGLGDNAICRIGNYDRNRDPLLSINDRGLGKIPKGTILEISPTKIPRVIGKKGSMINLLQEKTDCRITVGQNGLILAVGEKEGIERIRKSLNLIEKKAHLADLQNQVQDLLMWKNDRTTKWK